jgi:hypothetical protein
MYTGNQWCGYIVDRDGPFGSCIDSRSKYAFDACKYDVCRDQTAKCQALESFVERCYKSGASPDSNWRTVTGCRKCLSFSLCVCVEVCVYVKKSCNSGLNHLLTHTLTHTHIRLILFKNS